MSSCASVGGDDAKRLFLALRLPEDVLDALASWSASAIRDCRVLRRDDLHITLAFLGRQPTAATPGILAVLADTARRATPPELTVERWRETRSVGMLVLRDVTGAASRFAGDLHEALEALGVYRREARPWLPHVTVCRFRTQPRLRPSLPDMGTLVPSDAAAYISYLRREGAQYEVLETARLGTQSLDVDAKEEEERS